MNVPVFYLVSVNIDGAVAIGRKIWLQWDLTKPSHIPRPLLATTMSFIRDLYLHK